MKWCGVFDKQDGHIVEQHTLTEAKKVAFHHTGYCSDKANQGIKEGRYGVYYRHKNSINLKWKGYVNRIEADRLRPMVLAQL